MGIDKRALHLSSVVVGVGGVGVVGLFVTVLDPLTVLVVGVASALAVSVLKREVSVLLVIAIYEVSMEIRSSEAPAISGTVAVHLAINTLVLVLVGAFTLGVDELGFGFLLGKSGEDYEGEK